VTGTGHSDCVRNRKVVTAENRGVPVFCYNPREMPNIQDDPNLSSFVHADRDFLRIGARTSLETLSSSPPARAFAGGILADAARAACTSILRNHETVASAILSGRANGELVLALLVLQAEALLQTAQGPMPLSDLLDHPEVREAPDVLLEVRVPSPPADSRLNCERIARTPGSRSIVSVTALTRIVDGTIVECRVAAAGEGRKPSRLRAVEAALAGAAARGDAVQPILGKIALAESTDTDGGGDRAAMLPVLISRTILGDGSGRR
jgi:CO/xanthine dehydrogenase FAD-binding subunit